MFAGRRVEKVFVKVVYALVRPSFDRWGRRPPGPEIRYC